MIETLTTIVHVTTCLLLIFTVLLQSGRGGGMGAALGGGAGNQIFGGRGASTFLTKITSSSAIVFFLTSMTLAGLGSRKESTGERLLREKAAESVGLTGTGESADDSAPDTEAPRDTAESPEDSTASGAALDDSAADSTADNAELDDTDTAEVPANTAQPDGANTADVPANNTEP